MKKAIIFFSIISLVFATSMFPAHGQSTSDRETDEIKQEISRLYTVPAKKIAVHLKSGVTRKGYVNEMEIDTFIFVDSKTGSKTAIRYADVSKVERSGMSRNEKTALVAAGIGALIVVGIVLRPKAKPGLRCLLCN